MEKYTVTDRIKLETHKAKEMIKLGTDLVSRPVLSLGKGKFEMH